VTSVFRSALLAAFPKTVVSTYSSDGKPLTLEPSLAMSVVAVYSRLADTAGYRWLGAFAKLLRHVCPSVRMKQLRSHWTDFYEILIFEYFS
jgi:hypothetical protein